MSICNIPYITSSRFFWKFCICTRTFIFKCRGYSRINCRIYIRFNIRCYYKSRTIWTYCRCSKTTRNCLSGSRFSSSGKSKISCSRSAYRLKCSISFCSLSSSCIIWFIKIGNLRLRMSVNCSRFTCKSIRKSRYFILTNCSNCKCYFTWTTLSNCSTITFIYYSCRNFSNLFVYIFL